jgi:hypothetical protein
MSNSAITYDNIALNGRDYRFNCGVYSSTLPDLPGKYMPISFGNLQEITIIDNIFEPFFKGDVILNATGNFLENNPLFNFRFNSNNRNIFAITLFPTDVENNDSTLKGLNTLYLNGAIDNLTVAASDTSNSQFQSFEVKDVNQILLEEKKVTNIYEKINTSITVAENIKQILTTGIGKDVVNGLYNNGTEKITQEYIFPIFFNLADAINFLLPYNLTIEEDLISQLFLKFDYRLQQFKNFTIFNLFTNADKAENNLESFILSDNDGPPLINNAGGEISAPRSAVVPKDNKINNLAYNNVDFTISNEVLLPILVSNTTDFTNSNLFTYVDLQKEIDNFQKRIIDKLKPLYSNDIKLNVDLDPSKLNRQNYRVMTSPFNNELNVKVAKAQMYNSFVMHNMSMMFVTNGKPYRESGKFINIVKPPGSKAVNTPHEHKIFGQWLVTEVRHIITGTGSYKNVIQCVKPFVNK